MRLKVILETASRIHKTRTRWKNEMKSGKRFSVIREKFTFIYIFLQLCHCRISWYCVTAWCFEALLKTNESSSQIHDSLSYVNKFCASIPILNFHFFCHVCVQTRKWWRNSIKEYINTLFSFVRLVCFPFDDKVPFQFRFVSRFNVVKCSAETKNER